MIIISIILIDIINRLLLCLHNISLKIVLAQESSNVQNALKRDLIICRAWIAAFSHIKFQCFIHILVTIRCCSMLIMNRISYFWTRRALRRFTEYYILSACNIFNLLDFYSIITDNFVFNYRRATTQINPLQFKTLRASRALYCFRFYIFYWFDHSIPFW